jgi:hypothetical protein
MGIHEAPTPKHWNYFLAVEGDLIRLSRYLEPTKTNFTAHSLELARILFAAAAEVDVVCRRLCEQLNRKTKADNIVKYRKQVLSSYPRITDALVQIPRFGLTLNPWEQWGKEASPVWWRAYTNVKHQRDVHFAEANLKNALNAVAGLFVLLLFYYRKEAKEGLLNPDPEIFRAGHE